MFIPGVTAQRQYVSTGGGTPTPPAIAAHFDGINNVDGLRRGTGSSTVRLIGSVDGYFATFSYWYRYEGRTDFQSTLHGQTTGSSKFQNGVRVLAHPTTSEMVINPACWARTYNNGAIVSINYYDNGGPAVSGNWYHVIYSMNSLTGENYCYINDVLATDSSPTWTTNKFNWNCGQWGIGTRPYNGTNALLGCLGEVWATDEFIDLSVEANRRKFISADLVPADLGSDGSTPTGTQPLMYFHTASPDFETNSGSGGAFTEYGSVDTCT